MRAVARASHVWRARHLSVVQAEMVGRTIVPMGTVPLWASSSWASKASPCSGCHSPTRPGAPNRLAESRELLAELESDESLSAPAAGEEHDLDAGYRVWSQSYDQPLRLFPIESPAVRRLVDGLSPGVILDAACGSGRHSEYLAAAGRR